MQKWTLSAIKRANRDAGFFYWEPGKDSLHRTRTLPYVYQGAGGVYRMVTPSGFRSNPPC